MAIGFRAMQAAMASSMELDHGAMLKAQEAFTAAMKGLTVESLMVNPEPDANGNQDPNDRAQAQEKFNLLTGKYGNLKDRQGRSNMLANFLALSQIDPQLRNYLRTQAMPKAPKIDVRTQSMDELLDNTADNLIQRLSNQIVGKELRSGKAGEVIDKLAEVLAEGEKNDAFVLETMAQEFLTDSNEKVSAMISKGGELLTSLVTPAEAKAQASDIRKWMDKGLEGIAGLVTKDADKQETAVSMVMRIRNNASGKSVLVPDFALKLIDEVMGITKANKGVWGLMSPVRYAVSRTRQIFRQDMPKVLAKQFTRKLTQAEWGQLHLGLARTDLAALGGKLPVRNIREMITNPNKLKLAIKKTEEELTGLADKKYAGVYRSNAKDLARFMVTGEIDPDNHMLRRNALAIATLAGSDGGSVVQTKTV